MYLYYWIPRNAFVEGPGLPNLVSSLDGLKRATETELSIQFLDGEAADRKVALPIGTVLGFGLKELGKYEADYLAYVDTFVSPLQSSIDPFYTAVFDLNTEEINEQFNTPNGDADDDLSSIETMSVFFALQPGKDSPLVADVLTVTIANNGATGEESIPTPSGPATLTRVTALEQALPGAFLLTITGYTGGTGSKLDSIPTTSITPEYMVFFGHATEGLKAYKLKAGTTSEASPRIIRPDDYNTSTNAKYWELQESVNLTALATSEFFTETGTDSGGLGTLGMGHFWTYSKNSANDMIIDSGGSVVPFVLAMQNNSGGDTNIVLRESTAQLASMGRMSTAHGGQVYMESGKAGSTDTDVGQIGFRQWAQVSGVTSFYTRIYSKNDGTLNFYGLANTAKDSGTFTPTATPALKIAANSKITFGIGGTDTTRVKHGTAVLVAGTVTVADTSITSSTLIFPTRNVDGGTIGCSYSVTRSNGVSFTITSKASAGIDQTADTSTIAYELIQP